MIYAKYQNHLLLITLQEITASFAATFSKSKSTYYLIEAIHNQQALHQIKQKYDHF